MGFANAILQKSIKSNFFAAHGDECTIKRAESDEPCIVQFDQRARPTEFSADSNITGPDGSIALVKKTITVPKSGEVIVEANGTEHAVRTVRDLGYAWECRCETNYEE